MEAASSDGHGHSEPDMAIMVDPWKPCESASVRFAPLQGAFLQRKARAWYMKPEPRNKLHIFGCNNCNNELLLFRHPINNRQHAHTIKTYGEGILKAGWMDGARNAFLH